MSEHTPTPWRVLQQEGATSKGLVALLGSGWRVLADGSADPIVLGEEDEANARLIVRAVNAHAELLNALQRFIDLADAEYLGTDARAAHALKVARATIAKAEGQ